MKVYNLAGWVCVLILWSLVTWGGLVNSHVLPNPSRTAAAFGEMYEDYDLVGNILFSLKINILGYIIAIGSALPLGFAIGCFSKVRRMFDQPVNSLRFVPITALMGVFIALSGLTIWTKILFLAFGIWVYLVPVIVQRISEIKEVHLQMMKTLGSTKWQVFRYVQWPYVISRLSDDIRILVGISWTYIIVAELNNVQGGLGSMIWLGQRQSRPEFAYACIILIVLIGALQDWLFKQVDRTLFKFKYL